MVASVLLPQAAEIDPIEEMRLRTWARRNYQPQQQQRDTEWHPVVLDEMRRKDNERKAD